MIHPQEPSTPEVVESQARRGFGDTLRQCGIPQARLSGKKRKKTVSSGRAFADSGSSATHVRV